MTGAPPPPDAPSWRDRLARRARWLRAEVAALTLAIGDARTPWPAKAVAALAVCYVLSPIDLIPDVIPVIGLLDDLLLAPALIALAIRLIPADVMAAARARACEDRGPRGARRWVYAIPVVLAWLVLLALAARIVWRFVN